MIVTTQSLPPFWHHLGDVWLSENNNSAFPRPYVQLYIESSCSYRTGQQQMESIKGIMWQAENVLNSEEENLFRVTAKNCQPDLSLSLTGLRQTALLLHLISAPVSLCISLLLPLTLSDFISPSYSPLLSPSPPNILFPFPLPSTPAPSISATFYSSILFSPFLWHTFKLVNMLSVTSLDLI